MSVFAVHSQDTTDSGVIINGVKWATRNVDKPGTFAANPEDAGMFYQWNRKIGWSATDPIINSNGGTSWDATVPEGSKWEKTNDPSPIGWRIPTLEELQTLLDTDKVNQKWTTENGIYGTRFTDKATGNSIFLPAVGNRNDSDGALFFAGSGGAYWSSMAHGVGRANTYSLAFISGYAGVHYGFRHFGFSLRAVAK